MVVRCGVRGVAGEARTVVHHGNGAVRAAEQQDAPSGAWELCEKQGKRAWTSSWGKGGARRHGVAFISWARKRSDTGVVMAINGVLQ